MTDRRFLATSLIAMMIAAAAACGGSRAVGGAGEHPALPPVKGAALAKFDAGLRALSRRGPRARRRAAARFQAALAIDSTLWEASYNLGVIAFDSGDDDGAARAFSHALAINPGHRKSLLARAETYRRAGLVKKARADYEAALERDPEDLAVRLRLTSLLREAGAYKDAIAAAREALRIHGQSAAIYVQLGLLYLAQDRLELCELVLNKASAMDQKSAAVENALALYALADGDDQQAFTHFDRAIALDPDAAGARYNAASVLLDAGDYQRAAAMLEEILGRDPDDLEARVALGVALRGLGKLDRAKAAWTRVARDAPDRSRVGGDALYNLFILELDFFMDPAKAKPALDRYMQNSPKSHPKRKQAQARAKELVSP